MAKVFIFLLIGLAMVLGFFNPLYTDEITYRMMYSRLFFDHHQNFLLHPQCFKPDLAIDTSIWVTPFRMLESFWYNLFSSPLWIRATSTVLGGICVWLFYSTLRLVTQWTGKIKENDFEAAVTFSIFGLGTAPFLFVQNRPEQLLLTSILGLIILVLRSVRMTSLGRPRVEAFRAISFFILTALAFSVHPNALYFLVFFLVSAIRFTKNNVIRAASSLWVLLYAFDTFHFMSFYTSCPQDERLRQIMSGMALSPRALLSFSELQFSNLIQNVSRYLEYFQSIAFVGQYPFGWVSPHPIRAIHLGVNLFIQYFAMATTFLLSVLLARALFDSFKNRTATIVEQLGYSLALGLFALLSLQTLKNWYSSALVLPLLGVLFICFHSHLPILQASAARKKVIRAMNAAVALSLLTLFLTFCGRLKSDWQSSGARVSGGLSFSASRYSELEDKIWQTAEKCGFSRTESYKNLVVDDVTYWALRRYPGPMHAFYVSRSIYAQSIGDLEGFLRGRQSDGIIARCSEIADQTLLKTANSFDQYCCWNFKNVSLKTSRRQLSY